MDQKSIKDLIKENRWFLLPYFSFLIIAFVLLTAYSKSELHILLNKANSPFFDLFFKYATYLGDGIMIVFLFIALLFIKYRYAFAFLSGSLATSLFVNIIKKLVFHDVYRPSKYFELFETYRLHFVDGVKLHSFQSFPSGHTATAFNVFLTLAIVSKNNSVKLLLFIAAMLVGYSRVYLSQHFLTDIVAGSVFGVMFILVFWYWFGKFNKNWLDYSVIKRNK